MPPTPKQKDEVPKNSGKEEQLSTPDVTITMDSSSDSEGDVDYPTTMGYEPLPQEPQGEADEDDDDLNSLETADQDCPKEIAGATGNGLAVDQMIKAALDKSDNHNASSHDSDWVPSTPNAEAQERCQLWQESKTRNNLTLDDEKVQQIKLAMKNFQLPTSSHPDWASKVPESQWKSHLLENLKSEQSTAAENSTSDEKDFSIRNQTQNK